MPQIPAKKKKDLKKKTEEMQKILPTRVAYASNVILCPFSRFLSIIIENESYKISTLFDILNCKLFLINIFIYRYNQGPVTV